MQCGHYYLDRERACGLLGQHWRGRLRMEKLTIFPLSSCPFQKIFTNVFV